MLYGHTSFYTVQDVYAGLRKTKLDNRPVKANGYNPVVQAYRAFHCWPRHVCPRQYSVVPDSVDLPEPQESRLSCLIVACPQSWLHDSPWFDLMVALAGVLFRSRLESLVEDLALRQQLAIFKHERSRPRMGPGDRMFWVFLRSVWRNWANVFIVVEPDTVVQWQRQGFKWFWRWISKAKRVGRPRVPRKVQELIRRMARDNGWGVPRIHGELMKLGVQIDERTVSRYLPKRRTSPDKLRNWLAFLRNHRDALVGMDFFTVPTMTFGLLWVFVVLHHGRRRILHFAVTEHPEAWLIAPVLSRYFDLHADIRNLWLDPRFRPC
jgi:hypothetical protein